MGFSFSLFEPKKERLAKNDQPQVEVRTNGRIVFNQLNFRIEKQRLKS